MAPCFVYFVTTSRRQITPPFTAARFLRIHAAGNNPYLRDPKVRERTVVASVSTSSAIEGIRAPFKQASSASGSPRAPKGRAITKKS